MSGLSNSVKLSICCPDRFGLRPRPRAQEAYDAALSFSNADHEGLKVIQATGSNDTFSCVVGRDDRGGRSLAEGSYDYYDNMSSIVQHIECGLKELPELSRPFIGSNNEPLDWETVAHDLNALFKAGICVKLIIEQYPQFKNSGCRGSDYDDTTLGEKVQKIEEITVVLKTGYEKVKCIRYGNPFAKAVPDFPRVLVNIVIEYLMPLIGE